MSSTIFYNIFFMLGGIAIMMFGMKFMGSNLEQIAGNNMKKMLGRMTSNRFAGVGIGATVTAIINSSTATTVMLVGFVNVGLMSLTQATSVIMGANIGTTITAQILSLSGDKGAIDINAFAALFAATGMITTMVFKKDKIKKIGNILIGVGMIFIGLKIMSKSVNSIIYDDNGTLLPIFNTIFQNETIFPLLLVLIGIIFTALIQSSAAITGILIALGAAINFRTAVFIILGSNIGTCITSIISSIDTNTNAKRTAIIHLLFNAIGCLVCIIPVWIWTDAIESFMVTISGMSMERIIANFHTLFNLLTTAILLPFTSVLVKLAEKIIPEKNSEQSKKHELSYIDNRLLETPPIAMDNTKKELVKMSAIARENLNLAMNMLLDDCIDEQELFADNENALNFLNRSITAFMTKLMGKDLSNVDEKKIGTYFHVVSDIERVGDYAENIVEYTMKLRKEEMSFSDGAKKELTEVLNTINELFEKSIDAFKNRNFALLTDVDRLEENTDELSVKLENLHIERVKIGACSAQIGSVYLQTVSNLERIADHITNIAFSIKSYEEVNKNTNVEVKKTIV